MFDEDQKIRTKLSATHDSSLLVEMDIVDKRNTARIKQIVAEFGWPDTTLVGQDGLVKMFMIVQHSEFAFQEQMLPLVEESHRNGQLPGECVALLTDRILVLRGERQIYGTQTRFKNGYVEMLPCEFPEGLDERRASLGMVRIATYLAQVAEANGAQFDSSATKGPVAERPKWQ